jgi:ribonuclease J
VPDPVRVTFLGGLGEIGRNCAVLEQEGRLLLIDCGLMFPEETMPGVDLVLPDFTFLRENADRIEGCVLTHGHEDHVGALSYLLRDLSFPIFGSALTLGLARSRIEEGGLLGRTELVTVRDGERRRIGPRWQAARAAACGCSSATRPTPRRRATRSASGPSARCCAT